MNWSQIKTYLSQRLQESSTMRGVVTVLSTVWGWATDPARLEAYVAVGVLLAGLIGVALPDKKKAE